MRVLAHADPHVLETALLRAVEESQSADPLAPVLIVVPTARLAAHVERRVAERLGTRLAIEVAHHRALARRILEAAGVEPPEVAEDALLQTLLRSAVRGLEGNAVARFVAERPGALAALHRTIRDLREAGIAPRDAARVLRRPPGSETAAIYAAYLRALEARGPAGLADGATLVARAVPFAGAYASRFRAILHHGAYELIGVHLDLVKALDTGPGVTWLVPAEPGSPSARYAEAFASRHLVPADAGLEAIRAEGRAPSGGSPHASSTQGASAEAEWAARLALRAVADGARPAEVAIVARSLAPFTAAFEATFEEATGIWDASLRPPLRRRPEVRDFLLLVRAAAGGFPRATTAEALRSPCLRWTALLPDGVDFRGDLAEAWSRRAGVLGGLRAWTIDLPAWAAEVHASEDATDDDRREAARRAARRTELARALARAVEALAVRVDAESACTWSEHAGRLEGLYADLVAGAAGADSPLGDAFEHLRRVETRLGDLRRVPLSEALDELERVVDQAVDRTRDAAEGGIRVLDAAEARGLTFEHVFLVGMNAGAWPRPPREDPFLDDDARAALRESTGRPLGVKREAEQEERLLLASALRLAGRRLHVSWQHADEEGKAQAASPALREVARALGYADAAGLRHDAYRVAAHPKTRIDQIEAEARLLRPDEAALRWALAGEGNEAARDAWLRSDPSLAHGLEMLRATESFAPGDGRYDGRVGTGGPAPRSVTAVERLGRCPLQYFFRHRLGIYPLDEEASAFGLEAADLGNEVHALLERLYVRLDAEGLFASGDAAALAARVEALFGEAWGETLGPWGERLRVELPVLHEAEAARWRSTVLGFVREDLARLAGESARPVGFERKIRSTLDLGGGVEIELDGRLDRVLEKGGAIVVSDYKTSGNLEEKTSRASMLKGRQLQVPLYHLLAGAAATELLGVGPGFDPAEVEEEGRRRTFEGFSAAEASGFGETLRVLADLDSRGVYALRYDERRCGWCDYRRACRRNHPPTLEREENARDSRDYRDLEGKSTKRPALADARAGKDEAS